MSRAGVLELYIGETMLKMTSDRKASLSEVNLRSVIKFNSTVNDIFFLTCTQKQLLRETELSQYK